jgi:hypothetical protein
VVAVLLESNKIRNATHNIMAYRVAAPGKPGVFHQDFDDDGEAAAGGRLLHLLQVCLLCRCSCWCCSLLGVAVREGGAIHSTVLQAFRKLQLVAAHLHTQWTWGWCDQMHEALTVMRKQQRVAAPEFLLFK